ncbi:carboxymuconolactone decarboxylase family protein [Pseudomonas kulmbachensis]|uniref:carboxymuconolactone decarboxylase family protein n=1 Tax=Pseudomonas kulmbachensis TaxID=3043408 RepID=UPI002AB11017|nr:carboxymuconolactone decarboxylase family protein [Pseudomonas sp. V3/3/4/13]
MTTPTAVTPSLEDIATVSPALKKFTEDDVLGKLWSRSGLSRRDRSVVTLAAVITRSQASELGSQLDLALNHGVAAGEISEIITHLAFYAGWGNAIAAVLPAKEAFTRHQIDGASLPQVDDVLLALDEQAEAQRATFVENTFGTTFPGVVANTTDYLFRNLWLRPALAPRDRSLITVGALVTAGQVAQIPYHLNRAMDNGLTQEQASEVLTQLAFYAGWPNIFSAMPVFKDVFSGRVK